ncbi:hypothetical protein [Pseudomonas veronii]|uniref:hypothetical protein n=1 Tax=Pseudomonas veronii TaxID=76761 RepID=UPI000F845CBC|nr:hypothetical protein [Pseudomonas veronii]RTY73537.1 hypothetical protein EKA83_20610 [Pseudomonas veronii]
MSARDRNAARYRLDDSLNAWSTKWVLDGNAVHCAGGSAGQPARSADEAFRHVAGCPQAGDITQSPWRELAELLQQLPRVPA